MLTVLRALPPSNPSFDAFLLTVSQCTGDFRARVEAENEGADPELLDCYVAHASLSPNIVATYVLGVTTGSTLDESYSPESIDRIVAGYEEEEKLIDKIVSQATCPEL